MTDPTNEWKRRQKLVAERQPVVRIDDVTIEEGNDGYKVAIDGFGLRPAISPPLVTVGGVQVEKLRVEEGGRRLTGYLPEKPQSNEVMVDLGYACGKGKIKY
jgi:hypothetical protein